MVIKSQKEKDALQKTIASDPEKLYDLNFLCLKKSMVRIEVQMIREKSQSWQSSADQSKEKEN